jgi:hypothetical protein
VELGDVPGGGIVERQLSLVAELEDRQGGEALRHRGDPEDRVDGDRGLRGDVAHAERARVHEIPVHHHAVSEARHGLLLRPLAEETVDLRERGGELRPPVRVREPRDGRGLDVRSDRGVDSDGEGEDDRRETHWKGPAVPIPCSSRERSEEASPPIRPRQSSGRRQACESD